LIYDTFFHTLWRIAMLRLRVAQAAEEAVHDVFLSLWVRRESLRTDLDLRVYLAAAVRNRTRDMQAHERVVHSMETLVDRGAVAPPAIGREAPVADAVLETGEFWDAYRRALRMLTEREREAVLLRWEEEFTLEQVGRVLGMSTMGARALILRAQRKVQMALAEYRV
jgi:RNA polymerase sigma-70 factor (ECF subfamily)